MRTRFALLLALAAAPAAAQAPVPSAAPPAAPAPAAAPAPKPATVKVVLTTADGPITLEIEKERAPVTAANFLRYVDAKRLDGIAFYRAVKVQDNFGLVQFGVRNDPKRVYPNIAHEPTSKTGLSHTEGAIAMARAAPGTASGDFFIVVGDMSTSMDAGHGQPADNLGFAVFGRVTEGMDLVHKLLDAPTDPNGGPPAMKGQMLVAPVKVISARRAS